MEEAVCPSCGGFAVLDENSGWCASCTLANIPAGICIQCRNPFSPDLNIRSIVSGRRICSTCRKNGWFDRNGDSLDFLLSFGVTLKEAIEFIHEANRPFCVSCDEPIFGGTLGRHLFCTKYQRCKTAARSYRYYVVEKGLSIEDALKKVKENIILREIVG